jgi:hypothetical protein
MEASPAATAPEELDTNLRYLRTLQSDIHMSALLKWTNRLSAPCGCTGLAGRRGFLPNRCVKATSARLAGTSRNKPI